MSFVDELMVKITADSAGLTSGLKAAKTSISSFSSSTATLADSAISSFASVGKAAAVMAAGYAASALLIAKSGIDIGGSIQDTADAAGFAATEYRALGDSAEESGVKMERVTKGLMNLNAQVEQAINGSQEAKDKFTGLGFSLNDLATADNAERLRIVADAIANTGDRAKQTEIATLAFGRAGSKMIEWLKNGRKGLDDAVDGFNKVHGSIQAIHFAKLQIGRNAVGDISDAVNTLKMKVGESLTPAFTAAAKAVENFVSNRQRMDDFGATVYATSLAAGKMVGDFAQGAKYLTINFAELFVSIGTGLLDGVRMFQKFGQILTNVFGEIINFGTKIFYGFFEMIAKGVSGTIGVFSDMAKAVGMDKFAATLHSAELAVEGFANKAKQVPQATVDWNLPTPELDELIAKSRSAATELHGMSDAMEDDIVTQGTWGDQIKESIQSAKGLIDAQAGARVEGAKSAAAAGAEQLKDSRSVYGELKAVGAQYYNSMIFMANNHAQIVLNIEQAMLQARKAARDAAILGESERLVQNRKDLQNQMDVETAYHANTTEGKALREASLHNRIEELRIQRMKSEREEQETNLALWEEGYRGKLDVASNFLGQMSTLMNSSNRQMFEVGKAAAISKAVIDTYTAATGAYSAMASIPFVGPALGAAAAAAAIVSGLANVQRISSTSFGSKGSGGGSVGGGIGSSNTGGPGGQQYTPSTNVNVSLVGESFSQAQVRALIGAINNAAGDNVNLVARAG